MDRIGHGDQRRFFHGLGLAAGGQRARGSTVPLFHGGRANRFQFVWTNVPPGAYSLTAVATDNAGLQTTSLAANINVTTNLPEPQVRLVNPPSGAEFPDLAAHQCLCRRGRSRRGG